MRLWFTLQIKFANHILQSHFHNSFIIFTFTIPFCYLFFFNKSKFKLQTLFIFCFFEKLNFAKGDLSWTDKVLSFQLKGRKFNSQPKLNFVKEFLILIQNNCSTGFFNLGLVVEKNLLCLIGQGVANGKKLSFVGFKLSCPINIDTPYVVVKWKRYLAHRTVNKVIQNECVHSGNLARVVAGGDHGTIICPGSIERPPNRENAVTLHAPKFASQFCARICVAIARQ